MPASFESRGAESECALLALPSPTKSSMMLALFFTPRHLLYSIIGGQPKAGAVVLMGERHTSLLQDVCKVPGNLLLAVVDPCSMKPWGLRSLNGDGKRFRME